MRIANRLMTASEGVPETFINIAWTTAATLYPVVSKYSWLGALNDGRVVNVAGSPLYDAQIVASVVIGTISGGNATWVYSNNLPAAMAHHAGVILPDGRIMIMGGSNTVGTALSTVYFGTVTGNTTAWAAGTALPSPRKFLAASLLADGRVVLVGNASTDVLFGTISGNTVTWETATALPNTYTSDTRPSIYVRADGKVVATATATGLSYIGTVTANTIAWVLGANIDSGSRCNTVVPSRNAMWVPNKIGKGDSWIDSTVGVGWEFWSAGTTLSDGTIVVVGGTNFSTETLNVRFGVVS